MRGLLGDAEHLIRLAALLAICVILFFVLRVAVVPSAFGQYGHYRAGALDDNKDRPPGYAGQTECLACHDEQAQAKQKGKHVGVNCEACHGPLAAHVNDPEKAKPGRPDVTTLCVGCHERDSAKPDSYPQVVSRDHYAGARKCHACHPPHQPHPQKP